MCFSPAGQYGVAIMENVRITNCYCPFAGGAVYMSAVYSYTLAGMPGPWTNVVVKDNYAGSFAGGLAVMGYSNITITNGLIDHNAAGSFGGAFMVVFAFITLHDSTVSNCK